MISDEVAWHDAECGSYDADLALWEALADDADGPVLEVGSGTGRVALHLAGAGHELIAVERDPELARELERRAAGAGLELTTLTADLRDLAAGRLPSPPALVIGPMHVLQGFDQAGRRELLAAAARLLSPGGAIAFALVDESYLSEPGGADAPLIPDLREIDGWVFSSEPLWVQVTEQAISVRRLRQRVAPDGTLERSVHDDVLYRTPPDVLARVGAELGVRERERRTVRSNPSESDSIVVILEAR